MNEIEILIKTIEKKMKQKGLKKGVMGAELKMTPVTVASIFNSYRGSLKTLKKIIDYVNRN